MEISVKDYIDFEKLPRYLLIIGLIVILISGYIIYEEVNSAKTFCNSINGSYSYNMSGHICNNIILSKYTSGWQFGEKPLGIEINLSEFKKIK